VREGPSSRLRCPVLSSYNSFLPLSLCFSGLPFPSIGSRQARFWIPPEIDDRRMMIPRAVLIFFLDGSPFPLEVLSGSILTEDGTG